MRWLDRLIGAVNPQAGAARLRARSQMAVYGKALSRSYEAAKTNRRTRNWLAPATSANAEIGPALNTLRQRSRDLVRNNPWASKAVRVITAATVGTGILCQPRTGNKTLNKKLAKAWADWRPIANIEGAPGLEGLQALAMRTIVESGEVLVRRIKLTSAEAGDGVPLRIQLLEPDHIDSSRNQVQPNGNHVLFGIERDPQGRRVAYWLWNQHPGDPATLAQPLTSARHDAADIIHCFDRQRIGQLRGVPWLAPVTLDLQGLGELNESELVRRQVEASMAAFVTQADDGDRNPITTTETDEDGKRISTFGPGMVAYLKPGEDIKFNSPSAGGGFAEATRQWLRAIAAGTGVTYEALTGDLSQVNYSSLRAGRLEFQRSIEAFQWQELVPNLCQGIYAWFVDAALLTQPGTRPVYGADWTCPRFDAVDPAKDYAALVLAIRAGLISWDEAVAMMGYDPDEQIARIAASNAKLDAAAIILDSDPRRTAKAGAAAQEKPAKPGADDAGTNDTGDDPAASDDTNASKGGSDA